MLLNLGLAFLLAPLAAYCLYMGIRLLRINSVEFHKLAHLQSSKDFLSGRIDGLICGETSDTGMRHGLEISEDSTRILAQSRFSTTALRRAFPH